MTVITMPNAVKPRGKTGWPLQELYNRGNLGISVIENRRHWQAAQKLQAVLAEVRRPRGETASEEPHWSELADWRDSIPWSDLIRLGASYQGIGDSSAGFEIIGDDNTTADIAQPVDCSRWNVFRDLAPPAIRIENRQIIALAADLLGSDYLVLVAAIDKGWTTTMIGETQGYSPDSATASACGSGMLRSALRNLADFFVKLDRLENDEEPAGTLWRLVGTPLWVFDGIPSAWLGRAPRTSIAANDNELAHVNKQAASSR